MKANRSIIVNSNVLAQQFFPSLLPVATERPLEQLIFLAMDQKWATRWPRKRKHCHFQKNSFFLQRYAENWILMDFVPYCARNIKNWHKNKFEGHHRFNLRFPDSMCFLRTILTYFLMKNLLELFAFTVNSQVDHDFIEMQPKGITRHSKIS